MVLVCCPLKKELLDNFADNRSLGSISRFCKCFRRLNRRKFELKQKDIHLEEEEAVVYSKFTFVVNEVYYFFCLHRKLEKHGCPG